MIARFPAAILDAANVRVVRWRVGGRQPSASAEALRAHLATVPDPFIESRRYGVAPELATAGATRDVWRDGGGGDWIGVRQHAVGQRRGALVLLHGWLATDAQFEFTANLARPLTRCGFEVWTPWLPSHGPRTPSDSVSGARCLSADLVASRLSMARAVEETRSLVAWLRRRRPVVALWGVSLGGWIAALTAVHSAPLDALVLWAPIVDPSEALWRSSIARDLRAALESGGIDHKLLEEAVSGFTPCEQRSNTSTRRVVVMGGLHDNVVSRRSLTRLGDAWHARVRWYAHGHISMLCSRRARRDARAHITRLLHDGRGANRLAFGSARDQNRHA